ncbi:unnamed protein product [Allacma fusca]|uniref:Uncharacterized protein n=1 Tax=Allacma fusca TaxID=39272 RepID=A0A8J2L3M3_9HEXA|nr:unnamed protein product [Allacma fusca]
MVLFQNVKYETHRQNRNNSHNAPVLSEPVSVIVQVRLLVVNSDSQSQTATFLINSEDLITITLRLFTFWTAQFAPLFVR